MMNVYNDKKNCCGCAGCEAICPVNAITMTADSEGFYYPKIDSSKCINCSLCKKVCAFQNKSNHLQKDNFPFVFSAKNKNIEIQMKSTSGGIFSILAKFIIQKDGVVYGASYTTELSVNHVRITNINELEKCRGSKYVQSNTIGIFKSVKKDLLDGKYVLFTGTPCQGAGLKRYLKNVNIDKLILMDIICHGTPSPKLFKEYLAYVSNKRLKKVINYEHRNLNGWGNGEKIIFSDYKEEVNTPLTKAWIKLFYSNMILRPSCYNCKYTNINRESDFTVGDFWGIENYDNLEYDKNGVSLLLINSDKGKEIFNQISKEMHYKEQDINIAFPRNPQLQKPVSINFDNRNNFWNDYCNNGFIYIIKKYGGMNCIGKLKFYIKKIISAK